MEGPVSPVDLLETLQLTLEEQGVAFGSARTKEEEKRRADCQLREEQDIAYLIALTLDQVCILFTNSMPFCANMLPKWVSETCAQTCF